MANVKVICEKCGEGSISTGTALRIGAKVSLCRGKNVAHFIHKCQTCGTLQISVPLDSEQVVKLAQAQIPFIDWTMPELSYRPTGAPFTVDDEFKMHQFFNDDAKVAEAMERL